MELHLVHLCIIQQTIGNVVIDFGEDKICPDGSFKDSWSVFHPISILSSKAMATEKDWNEEKFKPLCL